MHALVLKRARCGNALRLATLKLHGLRPHCLNLGYTQALNATTRALLFFIYADVGDDEVTTMGRALGDGLADFLIGHGDGDVGSKGCT